MKTHYYARSLTEWENYKLKETRHNISITRLKTCCGYKMIMFYNTIYKTAGFMSRRNKNCLKLPRRTKY